LQPGHRGILVTQMDVAGCQSTLAEHHLFVVGAALGGEFFDEMAIALCRRGVGAVLEAQFGELQARFDEVRPAWDRWVSRVASSAKRLRCSSGVTATEQFLYGLGVNTVAEFLDYGRGRLINAPGLGVRARREIQDRLREWTKRLGKDEPAPLAAAARKEAKAELDAAKSEPGADLLRTLSLDTLATRFVPERTKPNAAKVDAVTRLLRIPGVGDLPELDAWPTQTAVAESLEVTPARVAQLLKTQRQQWKKDAAVQA